MRETLTISLPKELRRRLEKMAKAEDVTSSEYVRRAIKADIFRRALRAARRELVRQARAQGIYTDEDVFKIVSWESQPLPARVCRDEDDDVVLATALAGKADVIVTGDEDLLVLKKFRGIEILSPRQFLKLLDRTSWSRLEP
jgi:putative PIN family toxin of toxin-antitoxin system